MHNPKSPTRTAEDERRDLAAFARSEAEKFTEAAERASRSGNAEQSALCHAQAVAFRTMRDYALHVKHAEPQPANPDSYRAIALANGAKECNVYFHDERIVIVVEMALNRKLAEVHEAIFIRTPAAKYERIEIREVRAHHDSIAVDAPATPFGALPNKPADHLADLERRIAELERSVRNNTRRLDLAAAACVLPESAVRRPEWAIVDAFAQRLGAGLKEKP